MPLQPQPAKIAKYGLTAVPAGTTVKTV